MQVQSQLRPVDALIPYTQVSPCLTIQKKHWHVIASAQLMIPYPLYSLKVTQILLMFDFKIYFSVEIVVIPMVETSQLKIQENSQKQIEGYYPIQGNSIPLPISSGLYELPVCARCFLGYSCNTHSKN